MTGLDHIAEQPSWDCRTCGKPWPCEPARDRMRRETGGGTPLVMAAWTYFEDYVRDQGPEPSKDIYGRFLAWARRRDHP